MGGIFTYNNIAEILILDNDEKTVVGNLSVDEVELLIEALIYARLHMTHGPGCQLPDLWEELAGEEFRS